MILRIGEKESLIPSKGTLTVSYINRADQVIQLEGKGFIHIDTRDVLSVIVSIENK